MSLWLIDDGPVELKPNFTEADLLIVIKAAYKQVFGNAYLMESERNYGAESLLRNGDLTVRGFVSAIAKSDLYRSLFFERASQYRFIELNCKHFLGRPPRSQAEISQHVQIYNQAGYDAEIDSYIQSAEYSLSFGENLVPYCRTSKSTIGIENVSFNRTFSLSRGNSTSDVNNFNARLIQDLGANLPTKITIPLKGQGTPGNQVKRFRIVARGAGSTPLNKRSNIVYQINYSQMNSTIQGIHRKGGQILSITEIA